jgi:hypothetical protein
MFDNSVTNVPLSSMALDLQTPLLSLMTQSCIFASGLAVYNLS